MGAVSIRAEQQLEDLLQRAGDALSVQCLSALHTTPGSHHVTGPVPVQNIRSIYRLRAANNIRQGSPIQGFDALLTGLDAMTSGAVLIHSVKTPEHNFLAFTDGSTAHLAGVLRLPVKARESSAAVAAR